MMDLLLATSGGEAQAASDGYVDDVFSAYTYTGNGATQTINNGIDLAGKGGLVWIKDRTAGSSRPYHGLFDTARLGRALSTNNTNAQNQGGEPEPTYNSNGFRLNDGNFNDKGFNFVSWTFRKAPKFFDVVTYTGNSVGNRTLSHQLNADVGMMMVKATSTTGDWWVFHRSATGSLVLNTTAAQTSSKVHLPSATPSTFTVNGSANTSGVQYVAYLFAHDPSADGIIQCGSYAGNGSATGATVTLGWEPQYVLIKSASGSTNWVVQDNIRGLSVAKSPNILYPNISNAESDDGLSFPAITINATGFQVTASSTSFNTNGSTYIYLAIRRPNKPPTSGTQVYNAIARTGTGAAATVTGVGFAPDLVHSQGRLQQLAWSAFYDRLRGGSKQLLTTRTDAEYNDTSQIISFNMDGYTVGADIVAYPALNSPTVTCINHFFKRAKGFFDVVCYTGTGSATTVPHGLGVAPELMIVKSRAGTDPWAVYSKDVGAGYYIDFNSLNGFTTSSDIWNSTVPASAVFSVGTIGRVNGSGATYVAYLFASLAGISKVGSYTGNGTNQTINCGFASGARFILIKRTDSTGDWYVWDSVRGIIAANDPHLSLNTIAAEVTTDDSVDPEASGFIVNQNTATDINVSGGQYIFLAIA